MVEDAVGLELLRRLCEASDVADEARARLAVDGLVAANRFGEIRQHPLVSVERDARLAIARLARELRLLEPRDEGPGEVDRDVVL
jgi:phage terminase small subunit